MPKRDYYETLNVSKNADQREIKTAYRRLAMKFHPDRNPGNTQAESKFKEAKEAYEVLTDPQKRAHYDQYGHTVSAQGNRTEGDFSYASGGTADFGEIFGDVFGDIFESSPHHERRGSDLRYNMSLTLEEAVKGIVKKIRIVSSEKCPTCRGSGAHPGTSTAVCSTCRGQGKVQMRQSFFTVQQTCPACRGRCRTVRVFCGECRGRGETRQSRTLAVKIPPGVDTGDRIRISGKGSSGDNAPAGDLYVQIEVKKHPIFQRKEHDLYCEVPINFTVAALGGEIRIPTLDRPIKLKVPSETQTGRLFRIRGKGVTSVRNDVRGDLLCRVVVETPVRLNRTQHRLLEKLSVSLGGPNVSRNSPRSQNFFDRVKKFFDNLTL